MSPKSIKQAQRQLYLYKKEMRKKCERFVEMLAQEGITVAKQNLNSKYGQYITFSYNVTPRVDGAVCVMYATNTGIIKSEWKQRDGITVTVDVSPLLMAEFGAGVRASGGKANPKAKGVGMGQGTFPNQTHAFDPQGWWYLDTEYVWHHVYGVTPTMPMYHAAEHIVSVAKRVAKGVF